MRRLALVTLTALLLTGCNGGGSDDDTKDGGKDAPTATASATPAPTGPTCADIWKPGATLPPDYTSCVQDGVEARQDVEKCTDGTELVVFMDQMYAVTGGKILAPKAQPFQDSDEFGKVYTDCTGE
ncbi:hypothetical protein GCM10022234_30660 [Aeromicrobium panaciterrae]|uniref:hypothetical protein n=1 Tax=Aeromicrobium panaciterrae TaxID=363861 RepID=UPI0031DBA4C8